MRLKTLNGAPLQEDLDYSDKTLKEIGEDLPFKESLKVAVSGSSTASELDSTVPIKWRRLEVNNSRLRSGWSQPYLPGSSSFNRSFRSFGSNLAQLDIVPASVLDESIINDTTFTIDGEEDTTNFDFLNHSLILHDTLLSSQLALLSPEDCSDADNTISTSSFLTTSFSTSTPLATVASGVPHDVATPGANRILNLPPSLTITPLSHLPSPQHLRSIYPQTPTPTLLCVLTTSPEPRTVFVKKNGGYKMDLYELTLSDPTHSGFKVSFWFRPPKDKGKGKGDHVQVALRDTLESLQTGDVLLLRNIVLNVFRDTVYGQSLSPHIRTARTTVEILARAGEEPEYAKIMPVAVDEQFGRVRRWARGHVVPERRAGKRKEDRGNQERGLAKMARREHVEHDGLPPDTME